MVLRSQIDSKSKAGIKLTSRIHHKANIANEDRCWFEYRTRTEQVDMVLLARVLLRHPFASKCGWRMRQSVLTPMQYDRSIK
jgi:hypothetical protein